MNTGSWIPEEVHKVESSEEYDRLVIADPDALLYGLGCLEVSQSAVDRLGETLRSTGELHSVRTSVGPYYLLNVTTVVDCLDYDKSVLEFWPAHPKFMVDGRRRLRRIRRFVFLPDRIGGALLFKIPEFPFSPPYATQEFVARFTEAGLTGLEFRKVWPHPSDAEVRQMFLAKHQRKRQRKRPAGSYRPWNGDI